MRLIGRVDNESQARNFGGYLYAQGINSSIEPEQDGTWGVWVASEDHVPRATEFFREYQQSPNDRQYRGAAREAESHLAGKDKAFKRSRADYVDVRTTWSFQHATEIGGVTLALIVLSVVATLAYWSDKSGPATEYLFISDCRMPAYVAQAYRGLPEIRAGQVWRMFTPIFIHMTILHLVFNMFWLKDLGTIIERRQGALKLIALVAVTAAASNLAEYLAGGPYFGGMSGVIYALFGYIWIRGRFDPSSELQLSSGTVTVMLIWFVLCLVNVIPNVANAAHAAGLVIGMAWGFLSSSRLWRAIAR